MKKPTDNDDAEYYFIQFIFCKNIDLLRQENRNIYDLMLNKYIEIYLDGREKHIDLMDINKKYLAVFGIK
jgi:hypothetical protein